MKGALLAAVMMASTSSLHCTTAKPHDPYAKHRRNRDMPIKRINTRMTPEQKAWNDAVDLKNGKVAAQKCKQPSSHW